MDTSNFEQQVQNCHLFGSFKHTHFETVSRHCSTRVFAKGQTIFKQGVPSNNCLYILLKGGVDINRQYDKEKYIITHIGTDNFFGEFGFLNNDYRITGATTTEKTSLLEFTDKAMANLKNRYPDIAFSVYEKIISILTDRFECLFKAIEQKESISASGDDLLKL